MACIQMRATTGDRASRANRNLAYFAGVLYGGIMLAGVLYALITVEWTELVRRMWWIVEYGVFPVIIGLAIGLMISQITQEISR